MTWARLLIYGAIAAAVLLGIKAIRASDVARGDTQGAQRIQIAWDAQKRVDGEETLRLERERSADQLIKFRNAERITDDQDKRAAARERRIVAGNAVADQLRSTIETLNQRDLSTAGGDPGAIALAQGAATARELFGSCNKAFLGLAAEADRLKDQVAGLQDDAMFVCRAPKQTNNSGERLEPL